MLLSILPVSPTCILHRNQVYTQKHTHQTRSFFHFLRISKWIFRDQSWKMKERTPKIFCWLKATCSKHLCRNGRRGEMEVEGFRPRAKCLCHTYIKSVSQISKACKLLVNKVTSVPGIPSGKTRADGCVGHCVLDSLCRECSASLV